MTGLLFVRFSKPRPNILVADQLVLTKHNCAPTLMVRIANGRLTMLTHASARLGLLLFEQSAEGQGFRRVHELALSNPSIPLFPLTWTIMHEVDANSPLYGYDAERLAQADAQLFLTIEARDHAISAFVHDVRIYSSVDIQFGMHYAEAISFDEQRRAIADLRRLSLLEVDGSGGCPDPIDLVGR
jgi:inward rectifier potassium channel